MTAKTERVNITNVRPINITKPFSYGRFRKKQRKCTRLNIGTSAKWGSIKNARTNSTGRYPVRIAAIRLPQRLSNRIKIEATSSNTDRNILPGKHGDFRQAQMSAKIAAPNNMDFGSTRKTTNFLVEDLILGPR